MERKNKTKIVFLYILDVNNRGKKSRYFGHERIFYVGITSNIHERFQQHLDRKESNYLRKYFYDAKKTLVFVGYMNIKTNWRLMEIKVKALGTKMKKKLIKSNLNILENNNVMFGIVKEIKLKQPPPFYLTKENLKIALKEVNHEK